MKNSFSVLVFLLLTSVTSFAHPTDQQALSILDTGATIILLQAINITTQGIELTQGKQQTANTYGSIDDTSTCVLRTDIARDVLIERGQDLRLISNTLQKPGSRNAENILMFVSRKGNRLTMSCHYNQNTRLIWFRGVTIGEFKQAAQGVLYLHPAPPVSF